MGMECHKVLDTKSEAVVRLSPLAGSPSRHALLTRGVGPSPPVERALSMGSARRKVSRRVIRPQVAFRIHEGN